MTKNGMIVLLTVLCIIATAQGIGKGSMPSALALHDILVTRVIAPGPGQRIYVGDTIIPRARVKNFGSREDSTWVWMRIAHTCSSDKYVDSTWVHVAVAGESTVTFRPWTPLYPGFYRLGCSCVPNDTHWLYYFEVLGGGGVRESPLHPGLTQNGIKVRPNPVLSSALIRYSVATDSPVELRIFDAGGGVVRTLFAGNSAPGEHSVTWNVRDGQSRPVSNGIYFVSLKTPQQKLNRKLVVMR